MPKAVGSDRVLVLGPKATRQAAYFHSQIDGAADLREHLRLRLGIQQFLDDSDEGVRVFRVIRDRPNWLTLRGLDFCTSNSEMDQRFTSGFVLAVPEVNSTYQLAWATASQ